MGVDYIEGRVCGFQIDVQHHVTGEELNNLIEQLSTIDFIEDMNFFIIRRFDNTSSDRLSYIQKFQPFNWHAKTECIPIAMDNPALSELEKEEILQIIQLFEMDDCVIQWYHISYVSY